MSLNIETLQQEKKILPLFLSIALGGNSFLHPYIDEYYRKNEWEYYEAFQKSVLMGNPLISAYSTKSEEKIRQVASMLEWSNQNKQFIQVDQLIKKGYKFVYQYMQQHGQINFEHFMRAFAKRQKNKRVKEIELIYQNIVLWYLCERENKNINKENVTWKSFQQILFTSLNENKLQKEMFSEANVDKHRNEIDRLYEEYHINRNTNFDSLGVFLEYLISNSLNRIKELNPSTTPDRMEQLVFQIAPTKYIGALGGWLKTLNIQELDATEQIPLTSKDLDMVFLELLYAKKYNDISKNEQDLFFIACLYQKCLSFLYQDTKQLYLDQSKQDYYISMKNKESEIFKREETLITKQQEWQFAFTRQQRELDGLTHQLREANAKIRQLEQQIENMNDYTKEVHALRNFAYREEQVDHDEKSPSLAVMIEFIQSRRIVIFGGSLNWQQKLKEVLPSVEFIETDQKNRDISKIQRTDAVFINTTVFTHAFYKKIIKELKDSETPIFYINGQSNIEKTILEIYQWLTDN